MRRLAAAAALTAACGRQTLEVDAPPPTVDPTAAWSRVLAEAVNDEGLVDYDRISAERATLDAYVAWVQAGPPEDKWSQRLAFWINAYNALVIFSVLENGRPASVKDVPTTGLWFGPPGTGFFAAQEFRVGRSRYSLQEIEDELLRYREQDVRLHAALNCASRSCPPLRDEVYHWLYAPRQLDDQMRRFVNDPERGVRVEGEDLVVSPIFDWYAGDFRRWSADADLCTVLAEWAEPELADALYARAPAGCPHRTFEYDWSLNAAPR